MLDVAVIIVSWNVRDYLGDCLRSVYQELRCSGLRGMVWVVDNGSTDGTLALLDDLFTETHVLKNNHNVGFGAANNQGMRAALEHEPRYFFLLNPDTVVRPGALRELVHFLEKNPEAGMAGPRLVYGDGRYQESAFAFPGVRQLAFDLWPLPERLYVSRFNGRYTRSAFDPDHEPLQVDMILGAAMLVRRDVAEATGGFDESYHMYCEEIDWCWRIQNAGWKVYAVPAAEVVHYSGSSTAQVPARSIVNLWASRSQLYERMYGRVRLTVARKLAQVGLRRKAERSADESLRAAYQLAANYWEPDQRESMPQPDAILEQ